MGHDPVGLLPGALPPLPSRDLIVGVVAANTSATPTPTAFDEPVYVVLPDHSGDLAYPVAWGALRGLAMPEPGAPVLVAFDNQGVPRVVWWDGLYVTSGDLASPGLPTFPARVLGTAYQPSITRATWVSAEVDTPNISAGTFAQVQVLMDYSNPPTNRITQQYLAMGAGGAGTIAAAWTLAFYVPAGAYYKIINGAGAAASTLVIVYEYVL